MLKLLAVFTLAVLAVVAPRTASAAPLVPLEHGDFSYDTFALTWQPGFCSNSPGCLADQPRDAQIGLHGLWASLPASLAATGVTNPQWWDRGCDLYAHTDGAPPLDAATFASVDAVMPHQTPSLLTHEYEKHVACFGYDPMTFFTTELAMREAVVRSSFGRDLLTHAGGEASHATLVASFEAAFGTTHGASLQLRCSLDSARAPFLEQLWITIDAAKIDAFPAAASLIDAPIAEDSCPSSFHVPAWPVPGGATPVAPLPATR